MKLIMIQHTHTLTRGHTLTHWHLVGVWGLGGMGMGVRGYGGMGVRGNGVCTLLVYPHLPICEVIITVLLQHLLYTKSTTYTS